MESFLEDMHQLFFTISDYQSGEWYDRSIIAIMHSDVHLFKLLNSIKTLPCILIRALSISSFDKICLDPRTRNYIRLLFLVSCVTSRFLLVLSEIKSEG